MQSSKVQRTYLFESAPIPRAVASLAVPTVLSALVSVLYNLADTYFVGLLNDPVQNAAVTLAGPLMLAFYAIDNLFGIGASSMMSRSLGKKDLDTTHRSAAFGFYGALTAAACYSIVFFLFKDFILSVLGVTEETARTTGQYLTWTVGCGTIPAVLNVVLAYMVRSEGASLHASVGTMSGCVLNILLDPIFVLPWGLNMGAAGAGLATFLSNSVACAYFFVLLYVRRKDTCVCINPKMFCLRKDIVKGVCGVGIPAAIQNLLNVTGMTVLNNFSSGFGSNAVAAMGIAQKINMVPMQMMFGLSQGVMPLVGYNYASGNVKRMKKGLLFAVRMAVCFELLVALCFFFGSEGLIRAFMRNQAIVADGSRFLRGMCWALPFMCMDFMAVGVFQACGMGQKAFLFAVLRKIVLEIPALFALNFFFPLYGLAYAQFTAEFILSIAAVVTLTGIFRRLQGTRDPSPQ